LRNDSKTKYELRARARGYRTIAGVDEVGRGPLAGPVVACACILFTYDFTSRIDDSKVLSARQREKAFFEIVENASLGLGWADVDIISEINILNATKYAMKLALRDLDQAPDFVIVDGRVSLDVECDSMNLVNADKKSISVAAASIVAKVLRDSLMYAYHARYPHYEFASHKGYGTKRHRALIRKLGALPVHRKIFKLV